MDLEEARKTLSKRPTFTPKRVAFFTVAGLCLVGGIALRASQYFGQPDAQESPPATVESKSPAETTAPESQAAEPAPAASPPSPAAPPAKQAAEPASPQSPPAAETAAAPAEQPAPEPEAPAGEAADAPEQVGSIDAEQPDLPGAGMILVSRRPIEVLASPSSSSPALYGFPAGRPFRVIGREAGFAHIQDMRSKASGWIEEAALAPPPSATPDVSTPSEPKSPLPAKQKPTSPAQSAGAKPKAPKSGGTGAATDTAAEPQPDAEVVQTRRPGLFGRGGLFGGIFGGGN